MVPLVQSVQNTNRVTSGTDPLLTVTVTYGLLNQVLTEVLTSLVCVSGSCHRPSSTGGLFGGIPDSFGADTLSANTYVRERANDCDQRTIGRLLAHIYTMNTMNTRAQ